MAKTKTNTTKTLTETKSVTQSEIDAEIKRSAAELADAKKVKVKIPKNYQTRLGKMLPIGINGAIVYIPVNGESYEVPEPYKAILDEALENVNF